MKNIIWQIGGERLAYFAYADDADTQALAVAIKAANGVDTNWAAVAFDKALPAAPQEAWRLVNGEVVATAEDIAAHELARQPTPLQQIRALESRPEVVDAMARAARQLLLKTWFDRARALPAAAAFTDAQVEAWCRANDKTYKALAETEDAIKPLRALV